MIVPLSHVAERIQLARQYRGLTQGALAELLGWGRQKIHNLECHQEASCQELELLSQCLGFPLAWFQRPIQSSAQAVQTSEIWYRSSARTNDRTRKHTCAILVFVSEFLEWMEDYFDLPPLRLPQFPEGTNPEVAAEECRAFFGAGIGPIYGVLNLLERQGAWVARLETLPGFEFGACSAWIAGRPVVLLDGSGMDPYEERLEAMIQLGNLLLFESPAYGQRTIAARFAASLLASQQGLRPRQVSASALEFLRLIDHWRVPAHVLLNQALSIGAIDKKQKESLRSNLIQRHRLGAPENVPFERAEMVGHCLKTLGVGHSDLCDEFAAPSDLISRVTWDTGVAPVLTRPAKGKPPLRVVK